MYTYIISSLPRREAIACPYQMAEGIVFPQEPFSRFHLSQSEVFTRSQTSQYLVTGCSAAKLLV